MAIAEPGHKLSLDTEGRIAEDLECVKCAYNLRGLDPEGRCPECGLAVGRSALGHWLRYCDPDWLRNIWYGLNCISVFIAGVGAIFLLDISGFMDGGGGMIPEIVRMVLFAGVYATALVLGVIGIWKATSPEPARVGDEPLINARRAVRILPVATVAFFFAFVSLGADEEQALTVFLGGMLVSLLCLLWHAQGLAKRIPLPRLRWSTLALTLVLGIIGFAQHAMAFDWFAWQLWEGLYLTGLSGPWVGNIMSRGYLHLVEVMRKALDWGLLGCGIAVLILFSIYWRALKKQADLARQTWASQPFEPRLEQKPGGGNQKEGA